MKDVEVKPVPSPAEHPALAVTCTMCNAKPGEQCGTLLAPFMYRDVPHARRIEDAKKRS